MGHTEMSLAVAGLSPDAVHAVTRRLAGDWADFPDDQRVAFAFTRKQAESPWSITDADILLLEKHCGKEKAWHIIWWAARCHYMTSVADAFQFPLEKDNPFWRMPGAVKRK